MQNFPHRFYFFGSKDSIDTDALIEVNELLPVMEDNKRLLKELKEKYSLDWNANLITVGDGMITGCIIAPKSSPDSLNNEFTALAMSTYCLLYTSPSPRDGLLSRMPSSA